MNLKAATVLLGTGILTVRDLGSLVGADRRHAVWRRQGPFGSSRCARQDLRQECDYGAIDGDGNGFGRDLQRAEPRAGGLRGFGLG